MLKKFVKYFRVLRERFIISNSGLFDEKFYLINYPDVRWNDVDAQIHYIRYGVIEARNPNKEFDTFFYFNEYEDVRDANINPLLHYILFGKNEGRFISQYQKEKNLKFLKRNADLEHKPLISILMPTYNSPEKYLLSAVGSVLSQAYGNWELCVCDDGSKKETKIILQNFAESDERIKVSHFNKNKGISEATNEALSKASGEFIALLDHDDLLLEDSLLEIVEYINVNLDTDVIYSDQDKVDENGYLSEPFFKPNWSPELFLGVMYVGHLLVVRRELAVKVGGFNSKYDKVQDFEFILRVTEQTNKIAHIPKILYHWRMIEGSLASGLDEKDGIDELQANAVNEALARRGVSAKAQVNGIHGHRVLCKPLPRESNPQVSIIIPSKDAPEYIERCLASIFDRTTYKNYEVVVVDNETVDKRALEILESYPVNIVHYNDTFNFSQANNLGVKNCKGEIVILLNNDTEVITPDWIEILLYYLEKDDVGIVGPLLIFPDATVQHAGVVLGFRGTADHVMRGFPKECDGYAGSLSCTREVSSVTGACLMIRKDEYNYLGGLVEYYSTHYQDIDLCLKIINSGKRILYVASVELVHYESVSRKLYYDVVDRALLLDAWGDLIAAGDPYYNPNFTLDSHDYSYLGE